MSTRRSSRLHPTGKACRELGYRAFNGKLRVECFNAKQFMSNEELRSYIEARRVDYKLRGPHSSLGQLTPSEHLKQSVEEDNSCTSTEGGGRFRG